MARYPVGADGRLIETVIGGALPAGTIAEADRPPLDGRQIWQNGAWIWPVEVVRVRKLTLVELRFDRALEEGMPVPGGKVLQIRPHDQVNLTAMGNEARWAQAAGIPWPGNFAWRMADNTFLPLPTAQLCIDLAVAAKLEVIRLRGVKWGHDDAIAALATVEAIEAHNIEAGW
jgi:hypothetical protein